jgi:hypothetical protein
MQITAKLTLRQIAIAQRGVTRMSTLHRNILPVGLTRVSKEPVPESRSLEALPSGRRVVTSCLKQGDARLAVLLAPQSRRCSRIRTGPDHDHTI